MLEVVDDRVIPVVVGIPCMGELRMWSEHEEFRYFTDDPLLVSILGWGRVSRLPVKDGDDREIAFLDRENATLTFLPREQDTMLREDMPFRGHVVALTETPDSLHAGLHQLEEVLTSAIFHAAMAGGAFLLEPGSWGSWQAVHGSDSDERKSAVNAWVECQVHRSSEWDEHISLITQPDPNAAASSLWHETYDPDAEWNKVAVQLHGDGMNRAVHLMVEAAARWGYDPPGLVLTFRGN